MVPLVGCGFKVRSFCTIGSPIVGLGARNARGEMGLLAKAVAIARIGEHDEPSPPLGIVTVSLVVREASQKTFKKKRLLGTDTLM